MKSKIWLSSPHMGDSELDFIHQAFEQNWVAPLGPNVDGFENDITDFLGNDVSAAALSAGTAAIHLGLILLGVGRDDEVLCQSFTFSASANPVTYVGASPVFIDSEMDTYNMSPEFLVQAIEARLRVNKKPKAIIPVHLYGMPAKIDKILEIASAYNIPVLEDAAEALGSSFNGRKCGTFGDLSILSFNGNKIITTSSGGALVSTNSEFVKKARFLSTQARDAAPHYEHSEIGYNYRMSNICAGIGRGQMRVLAERVNQRRHAYELYQKRLSDVPGIQFLPEPEGAFSNRWLTTIIVHPEKTGGITREDIRIALEKENIESRPLWKPMHLQPVFANCLYFGEKVCETLFDRGLCLPSGSNLSNEDFDRIFEVFEALLKFDIVKDYEG